MDGSDDDHEEEEDDEEEEVAIPYGRRSLAWTERYRKLLPYETARLRAMSLGLRSKDDWDEHLEDGKVYQHGPYLPSRPDEMYAADWVSWDEFLGIMRSYDEARQLVQTLGLRSEQQYTDFVKADTKRAEGLRIPAKPEIVYRNEGWTTPEDFYGTATVTENNDNDDDDRDQDVNTNSNAM